ncbi:group III truncated hemoglobin [Hoeflea sp.]|uniref:group III truncated hemoglobin n=2 Tax=Hoeflea sp. TaxID=1940281 RepID=UPI003BAD1E7A
MTSPELSIISARPKLTAAMVGQTGLNEEVLRELVHRFYGKVREDRLLAPIFEERVSNWTLHLERMVAFWSSAAIMTGRYHGRPVPMHTPLPIDTQHFGRWLELFRETAREVCTPAGATHVIERAERIARSLQGAVREAQSRSGTVACLD